MVEIKKIKLEKIPETSLIKPPVRSGIMLVSGSRLKYDKGVGIILLIRLGKFLIKAKISCNSGGKIKIPVKKTAKIVIKKTKITAAGRGKFFFSKEFTMGFKALIKIKAKNNA
jgi:hypothetical protein